MSSTGRSSGRKKDPVWKYYKEIVVPGKKGSRAECLKCKKDMQGLVARLISHHEKCQVLDSEDEEDGEDLLLVDEVDGSSKAVGRSQPKTVVKVNANNLSKFVIKTILKRTKLIKKSLTNNVHVLYLQLIQLF